MKKAKICDKKCFLVPGTGKTCIRIKNVLKNRKKLNTFCQNAKIRDVKMLKPFHH